ncbi:MAG: alpha/beta fold hydrolase [Arachnia propionica]|uniref:thioesterase II family protein n=1 Tax=Arachnia propionica TaxID=1750 RepID=UPI0027044449|nr:alpha/beta fold hydrolase [Arachnia propionica]
MSRVVATLPGACPAGRALVLFPHAGGSPRFFRHWVGRIPGVHLLGVTYPGRDHRIDEPHPGSLTELAEEVAHHLRHLPDPVLFGHSMGALVAHEVAGLLTGSGGAPELVVSGHDAPCSAPRRSILHNRPDHELIADLVRLDHHNAEVFALRELADLFLPAIREDYRMVETHRTVTRQRIPRILVINGDHDPEVTATGATAWCRHAARFDGVQLVDGGHFHHAAPRLQCCRLVGDHIARRRVATP